MPEATLHDRDYIAKRAQYQERGIPEYWLVDPQLETVLLLTLTDNGYTESGTFKGSDRRCLPP